MDLGQLMDSIATKPADPFGNHSSWARVDALCRNNIDAIRFALATIVNFSHSYALLIGSDRTEPLYRFSGGQRTLG